jgi:hypothetical protein
MLILPIGIPTLENQAKVGDEHNSEFFFFILMKCLSMRIKNPFIFSLGERGFEVFWFLLFSL